MGCSPSACAGWLGFALLVSVLVHVQRPLHPSPSQCCVSNIHGEEDGDGRGDEERHLSYVADPLYKYHQAEKEEDYVVERETFICEAEAGGGGKEDEAHNILLGLERARFCAEHMLERARLAQNAPFALKRRRRRDFDGDGNGGSGGGGGGGGYNEAINVNDENDDSGRDRGDGAEETSGGEFDQSGSRPPPPAPPPPPRPDEIDREKECDDAPTKTKTHHHDQDNNNYIKIRLGDEEVCLGIRINKRHEGLPRCIRQVLTKDMRYHESKLSLDSCQRSSDCLELVLKVSDFAEQVLWISTGELHMWRLDFPHLFIRQFKNDVYRGGGGAARHYNNHYRASAASTSATAPAPASATATVPSRFPPPPSGGATTTISDATNTALLAASPHLSLHLASLAFCVQHVHIQRITRKSTTAAKVASVIASSSNNQAKNMKIDDDGVEAEAERDWKKFCSSHLFEIRGNKTFLTPLAHHLIILSTT